MAYFNTKTVILSQSKKKLSKREGDVAVEDFRRKGYLPDALINYVALVGWSPEDGQEILSMTELIEKFSFERVSKSSGVFDVDKLNWVNNQYIRAYDLDVLTELCKPYFVNAGFLTEDACADQYEWMKKIVDVLRERLNRLDEISAYKDLFLQDDLVIEAAEAEEMILLEHVPELLKVLIEKIEALPEMITAVDVKQILKAIQKELGVKGKGLFMPVRVAITGQVHGPDIAKVIEILGNESVIKRIKYTLAHHCKE